MTEKEDTITRYALRYVDVLLLKNPERTVLGILLGVVLAFLSRLFEPVLIKSTFLNLSKIQSWGWIPLGIVVVHLPYILLSIVKKPRLNDQVEDVIKLIETSNFTEKEKRQIYRSLVNKCIEDLSLQGKKVDIPNIAKEL